MKYFQTHIKPKHFLSLLFLTTLCILAFNNECYSVTYYVDFDNGNNANNGTSISTPWRSLPGSQNPVGGTSGWKVIKAGDVIYIKAGTIYSSSDGGRIHITNTWYNNGTSGSNITIQVSDSWGTGNVIIDGAGITLAAWTPLVWVAHRNYMEIKGASTTKKLIIQNSQRNGFVANGTSVVSKMLGFKMRYVEVNYSGSVGEGDGIVTGYADGFEIRDCVGSYNKLKGFDAGFSDDQNCDGGKYYDCVAHHNGYGGTGSESFHGFGLYGCTNMEYWRCISYSNTRDGFDFGTCSNSAYGSAKVINCTAYSNGEDGFACNGVYSGYTRPEFWYVNCVAYGNAHGLTAYDGVIAHFYHCVSDANGDGAQFFNEAGCAGVSVEMKNCILTNNTNSGIVGWTAALVIENFGYNLYERGSGGSAYVAANYEAVDYFWANFHTWQTATGDSTSHDDVGDGWVSNFVDRVGHNYYLQASSNCIGKGVYLSTPVEVLTDRDEKARSNPPTIGPYEYEGRPQAPTALRIL